MTEGFIQVPMWLAVRMDLSDGAKMLWAYLADRQRLYGDGRVFESRERIAAAIGTTVSGYKRRTVELSQLGLLEIEASAGPRGANVYVVKEPPRTESEPGGAENGPGRLENGPGRTEFEPRPGPKVSRGPDRIRAAPRTENGPRIRVSNQPSDPTDEPEEEERASAPPPAPLVELTLVPGSSKAERPKPAGKPAKAKSAASDPRQADVARALLAAAPQLAPLTPTTKHNAPRLAALLDWAEAASPGAPMAKIEELAAAVPRSWVVGPNCDRPLAAIASDPDGIIREASRGPRLARQPNIAPASSREEHDAEIERAIAAGRPHGEGWADVGI